MDSWSSPLEWLLTSFMVCCGAGKQKAEDGDLDGTDECYSRCGASSNTANAGAVAVRVVLSGAPIVRKRYDDATAYLADIRRALQVDHGGRVRALVG